MGILNVTPDSFSDAGRFFSAKKAVQHAKQMIREGADIIDVGGESSGPGSKFVTVKEELRRVIPVIKKLADEFKKKSLSRKKKILISVDTYKACVAQQAIKAGVRIVNDVTALRGDKKMAEVIAKTGVKIILMYSKDSTARTTRKKKHYKDVVASVMKFLKNRARFAIKQGIKRNQIIIDPGMGAFISAIPKYSFEILARLKEFKRLGFPILIGTSRKSFLGGEIKSREIPTFITNLAAIQNGANIIRVHNVALYKKIG
ncbi:dihydropteroate synthase [Candidatus Peregrinibacteria bacterium]|nr:dihydropteroate synthase [Candidatus Peregrinibacteria bacterium]